MRQPALIVKLTIALFGWILLFLGQLKLLGLLEPNSYLGLKNALFPFVTNAWVVLVAGAVELGIGFFIIVTRRYITGAWLILWLTTGLNLYTIGLGLIAYHGPCPCLVGLTHFIPLTPRQQNDLADFLAMLMFVGSLFALCVDRIMARIRARTAEPSQNRGQAAARR